MSNKNQKEKFDQMNKRFIEDINFNATVMIMAEMMGAGFDFETLNDSIWFARFVRADQVVAEAKAQKSKEFAEKIMDGDTPRKVINFQEENNKVLSIVENNMREMDRTEKGYL